MYQKLKILSHVFLLFFFYTFVNSAASSTNEVYYQESIEFIENFKKLHPEATEADALKEYENNILSGKDAHSNSSSALSIAMLQGAPFDSDESSKILEEWIKIYKEFNPNSSDDEAVEFFFYGRHLNLSIRRYILEHEAFLELTGLSNCCHILQNLELKSHVQNTIIDTYPEEIKMLLSTFKSPLTRNKAPSLICLHGEPGVGKTSFGTILALETQRPLLYVKCSSVENEFQQSGVQNLHRILDPLTQNNKDPWVVLLDEVDGLDSRKSMSEIQERRANIFSTLQSIIDDNQNPNISIIATSNFPNAIDNSVKKRAQKALIKMPLPSFYQRKKIIQAYLQCSNLVCSDTTLNYLAWTSGGWLFCTKGLSGRDIKAIVEQIEIIATIDFENEEKIQHLTPYEREIRLKNKILEISPRQAFRGVSFIKNNLYNAGVSLTDEGRLWQEIRREMTLSNLLTIIGTGVNIASINASMQSNERAHNLQREMFNWQQSETFSQRIQNWLMNLAPIAYNTCQIQ